MTQPQVSPEMRLYMLSSRDSTRRQSDVVRRNHDRLSPFSIFVTGLCQPASIAIGDAGPLADVQVHFIFTIADLSYPSRSRCLYSIPMAAKVPQSRDAFLVKFLSDFTSGNKIAEKVSH